MCKQLASFGTHAGTPASHIMALAGTSVATILPARMGVRCARRWPSGESETRLRLSRERLTFRRFEHGDRLKAIVAGAAMPEIDRAPLFLLDPIGRGDRLAALGTGILLGQITETCSSHGAAPFGTFLVLEVLFYKQIGQEGCPDPPMMLWTSPTALWISRTAMRRKERQMLLRLRAALINSLNRRIDHRLMRVGCACLAQVDGRDVV
jgi:hypothetical protein